MIEGDISTDSTSMSFIDSQVNNYNTIQVADNTKIIVDGEEITGKELGAIIKLFKVQFPEVFI